MRKFLSMLLALSMVLTMLAACNQDPVDAEEPDDPNSQEEVQGDEEVDDGTLNLVVDGVSEYVIVRGENAYISEVTASTELQAYLKKITGVEIPIVTDSTAPVEKEIVVGKTNREDEGEFDRDELGDDGLVIKTDGKKLFLVGGEQRGTLYAVYEFLESYLGCGFYTVDIEVVPQMATISLDPIEEDKQIPVFELRSSYWAEYQPQNIAVKRKLNAMHSVSEEFGGLFIMNPWVHSFGGLVSFAEYSATHPEYFAHYDDGTIIDNNPPQLCLTNDEVLQLSIETVRNWILSTPNVKVVSVSQNDGGGPCMCSGCQAVYAEENGAYSGAVIRFVNAIATALKDEFPNVRFETLAYQYTRNVCVTKPVENVIVRLCTIECCFTHSIEECDVQAYKPKNSISSVNSFATDLRDWANLSDTLYIWDYTTNFDSYTANFSSFQTLKDNVKFFADNKVTGLFEQGNYHTSSGEFGELRAFLLSKLLWDPYMSEEEYYALMDEFLLNVYGPGWTYIREYIDFKEEFIDEYHYGCKTLEKTFERALKGETVYGADVYTVPEGITLDMIQNYETVDWSPYITLYSYIERPEIISKGYECFEKALELAETETQTRKLNQAMIQVEFFDSYYRYEAKQKYVSNINSAVRNVLNTMDISREESNVYLSNIRNYVTEFYDEEYFKYNQTLASKMIAHGVNAITEGSFEFANRHPNANYYRKPGEWHH